MSVLMEPAQTLDHSLHKAELFTLTLASWASPEVEEETSFVWLTFGSPRLSRALQGRQGHTHLLTCSSQGQSHLPLPPAGHSLLLSQAAFSPP